MTVAGKMSRAEQTRLQAGSFTLLGWEGNDVSEPLELIKRFRPAGLVFFKRNYPEGGGEELKRQLRVLRAQALSLMGRTILLAIDNEGGTVRRLPEPHIQLPSAHEARGLGLGAIFEACLDSGRELSHLGFNLNLAPVLDLKVEGSFMGTRCFSGDPQEVSNCAKVFYEGFRTSGVLCCGKHFPGLGAAVQDPHSILPAVDLDKKQMQSHLKPFKDLINLELPLIMTSHCRYPGVGISKPATFAPEIINLLRQEMSFDGLILSDDLEMGAVVNHLEPGEAAVSAVLAGHDLILICRKLSVIERVHEALAEAMASGRVSTSRFVASYGRLCSLVDSLNTD
jgi:beta-N-acetylhexosaminidase